MSINKWIIINKRNELWKTIAFIGAQYIPDTLLDHLYTLFL